MLTVKLFITVKKQKQSEIKVCFSKHKTLALLCISKHQAWVNLDNDRTTILFLPENHE